MAGKDTKTKIKEISVLLFRKNGFDRVTINEICEQCGINKHTFYYYFKSKDDLLRDYYEFPVSIGPEYFTRMLDAKNYVEQLWLSYQPFLDHIEQSGPEIPRQLFIKNINHDVGTFHCNRNQKEHMDMQAGIIEKGQAAGELRNASDPKTLCVLIHQMFVSILFLWCVHGGAPDLSQYVRAGIESLLDVRPDLRTQPDTRLAEIWKHRKEEPQQARETEEKQ